MKFSFVTLGFNLCVCACARACVCVCVRAFSNHSGQFTLISAQLWLKYPQIWSVLRATGPHLCKPTAWLSPPRCIIPAQVYRIVPIKNSDYPLSIFFRIRQWHWLTEAQGRIIFTIFWPINKYQKSGNFYLLSDFGWQMRKRRPTFWCKDRFSP